MPGDQPTTWPKTTRPSCPMVWEVVDTCLAVRGASSGHRAISTSVAPTRQTGRLIEKSKVRREAFYEREEVACCESHAPSPRKRARSRTNASRRAIKQRRCRDGHRAHRNSNQMNIQVGDHRILFQLHRLECRSRSRIPCFGFHGSVRFSLGPIGLVLIRTGAPLHG